MATSNTISISIDIDAGTKNMTKVIIIKTKNIIIMEKKLKIFHFYLLK